MGRPRNLFLLISIMGISGFAAWMYAPVLSHRDRRLSLKWEGAVSSKINFRDAGASINECLGRGELVEGRLFRSSEFFSGWSCDRVGRPDTIYSLNYSEPGREEFFCATDDGINIGRHYQASEISDIEFIETWDKNPAQTKSVCAFVHAIQSDLASGRKALIHCEAGRDRTGAMTALLAALEFEASGTLTDDAIAAIECDYRKSQSLKDYKYGRMERFLKELGQRGGVGAFLERYCGKSPSKP
jgi:hypothetical protein